jgi:anti-sigma B factor antagonist
MQVTTELTDGTLVMTPDEVIEVDVGTAEAFKAMTLEAMGGHSRVVLDASPVSFFDSAGMGVLLSLKKQARENGGDLVLAGLRPAIHEIFQMIGFDTVFKIFPDTPKAVQDFNEGQP